MNLACGLTYGQFPATTFSRMAGAKAGLGASSLMFMTSLNISYGTQCIKYRTGTTQWLSVSYRSCSHVPKANGLNVPGPGDAHMTSTSTSLRTNSEYCSIQYNTLWYTV